MGANDRFMTSVLNPMKVLVVEDEALIRFELVDILEDAGLTVLEAGNADEAITVLEAHTDIRLVLTDIQMPGNLDGVRLAHFIHGRWPPISLLIMSGNVKVAIEDLPERSVFLPKPFHPPVLLRKIGDLTS